MKVLFKPTFIKDLKRLPDVVQEKAKDICCSVFPKAKNLLDLQGLAIQKLKGYNFYYRFRIGSYRFGFKVENKVIIFMRALPRKDIYRFFP